MIFQEGHRLSQRHNHIPYTTVYCTTTVFEPVLYPLGVLLRVEGRWTVNRTRHMPVQLYGRTRTKLRYGAPSGAYPYPSVPFSS
jgi:hypothetical protein